MNARARRLRPPPGVEARYVRQLRGLFRSAHALFVDAVMAHYERRDAIHIHSKGVDRVEIEVLAQVPEKVPPLFAQMATPTARKPPPPELVAITPRGTGLTHIVDNARDENIRLVESALRDYAQDVRDIFDDPEAFGLAPDELRKRLVDRGNVSESRAELIARDQTLKLNSAINQAQQTAAGVTSYVWSTSGDARVREEHAALNGETFDWDSPPEPGHPGEDYQCRCVPIPVLPEFDDAPDADGLTADCATSPARARHGRRGSGTKRHDRRASATFPASVARHRARI